jgi:glutaredoxin-like YruB-family protein
MKIKLYSKPLCGWCQEAKAWLQQHQLEFESIDVGQNPAAYEEMKKLSGQTYVPVIVVNGQVLADFDVTQLEAFLAKLKT